MQRTSGTRMESAPAAAGEVAHGPAPGGSIRGIPLSLLGVLVQAVATAGFVIMVSRTLSQSRTGAVVEMVNVFVTATFLGTCGADIGLQWILPKYRAAGRRFVHKILWIACSPAFLVALLLACVLFVEADPIARLLVHSGPLVHPTSLAVRVVAPLVPISSVMTVILAGSRAWGLGQPVVTQFFVVPLLRLALLGGILVFTNSTTATEFAWGLPVIVGFLLALLALRSLDVGEPSGPVELPETRALAGEFWRFSAVRSLDSALVIFLLGFDVIMAGAIGSADIAAQYAVATRCIAVGFLGMQAVLVAMPVRISELMSRRLITETIRLYREATFVIVACTWPVMIALFLFAPFFMSIFGPRYETAYRCLMILCGGGLVSSATGPSSVVLLMAGNASVNMISTALAATVNIVLDFVLIPRFGVDGAAWAWTAGMAVMNLFQVGALFRLFRMHLLVRDTLYFLSLTVLCFGLYGALIRALLGTGIVAFVTYAVSASVIYLGILLLTRRFVGFDLFSEIRALLPGASELETSAGAVG